MQREDSAHWNEKWEAAGRAANEIEGKKVKNRGRGQMDPEERDYENEEMAHSGVFRPDQRLNGPRSSYVNQDARSSAPVRFSTNNRRDSSDNPALNIKPDNQSNFARSDSSSNEFSQRRNAYPGSNAKDNVPQQWRKSDAAQPPSGSSPNQNAPIPSSSNQNPQGSASPRPPAVASPRITNPLPQQAIKQPPPASTPPAKPVPAQSEGGSRGTLGREPLSQSSSTNQNVHAPPSPVVTQNIQSFNAGTVNPLPAATSRESYSHKAGGNNWPNQRRSTPTGDGGKFGTGNQESQSARGSQPQRQDSQQQPTQQQPSQPSSNRPPQQGGANRQVSNSTSQEKFENSGQRKSQSGERGVERNERNDRNAGNQGGFQQAKSGASSGDERTTRRQDGRQDGGAKEYGNQSQQWTNQNVGKVFVNSSVAQNQSEFQSFGLVNGDYSISTALTVAKKYYERSLDRN